MKVSVLGAGFVGLVTGACLAERGHDVTCIDLNAERVAKINNGIAPFFEPDLDALLRKTIAAARLRATSKPDSIGDSDVIFICVGTPSTADGIDLAQVKSAAELIGGRIRTSTGFPVVVMKSTVVPGTADGVVRHALEAASGKIAGVDFGLCSNPEFLREGSAVADFRDPDRIVIGASDTRTAAIIGEVYQGFECPVFTTTLSNAEMSKYASNCLLATLISYSNEFARMCERTADTDVELVMDSLAADRRLSPMLNGGRIKPDILSYLRAGIGFGGSCLPKDVIAFRNFAKSSGAGTPLFDAVHEVNETRADDVVALAESVTGSLAGKRVALFGLAFKPGTDDVRDSPALRLAQALQRHGCEIVAYDPLVKELPPGAGFRGAIAASAEEALSGASAAFIATAWPDFARLDWFAQLPRMKQPVIVDGRNILRRQQLPEGTIYLPIGRSFRPHTV